MRDFIPLLSVVLWIPGKYDVGPRGGWASAIENFAFQKLSLLGSTGLNIFVSDWGLERKLIRSNPYDITILVVDLLHRKGVASTGPRFDKPKLVHGVISATELQSTVIIHDLPDYMLRALVQDIGRGDGPTMA